MIKRVSVVGLGKLGACMAATMASKGFDVVGVDVNRENVDRINNGLAPVTEPHLSELIAAHRTRLRATTDFKESIRASDVSFIIVPTPSNKNRGFSLRFIEQVVEELGPALKEKSAYHLVVITSTVLPGSTDYNILPALELKSGKTCGNDFGLCYNPEFIALGSVIHDLLHPDFILIGESDQRAGSELEAFYGTFCNNQPPVKRMNFVNAELTKISVNTFVTTKITFANMLASICEELSGADIDTVSAALGMDSRIGRRYLTGALGYGGPCFPRDNKALSFLAEMIGAPAKLAEATDHLNDNLLARQAEKIRKLIGHSKTVSVLGLAYKPDTNVVEESQGVALAKSLVGNGNQVMVYDPLAMDNASQVLKDSVAYASSVQDCLDRSDAVIITNPSKEFQALEAKDFPRRGQESKIMIFDCWRILRGKLKNCDWVHYIPLGVGAQESTSVARLSSLLRE